jgi:hypothetical protein
VDVYPLYENAGRAAYGQTLEQGQAESAEIWSLFKASLPRIPMLGCGDRYRPMKSAPCRRRIGPSRFLTAS